MFIVPFIAAATIETNLFLGLGKKRGMGRMKTIQAM
jgi:hypothetical protein